MTPRINQVYCHSNQRIAPLRSGTGPARKAGDRNGYSTEGGTSISRTKTGKGGGGSSVVSNSINKKFSMFKKPPKLTTLVGRMKI